MAADVRLEPLRLDHVAAVALLVDDPAVQRFTRVPVPPPEGFAATWVAAYEQGRAEGVREGFAILDASDGAILGVALAPRLDTEGRTAELGYAILPSARGRGVATAALRDLTAWALDVWGALRVELLISAGNEGSRRVAAACGYVHEGTLRSTHFKQGRREDTEIWSILPGDTRA